MTGLHMQIRLARPTGHVFNALSDSAALRGWFAEHAEIDLKQDRYDFWGRFTPGNPGLEQGQHPLTHCEEGLRLGYRWRVNGADRQVDLHTLDQQGHCLLVVRMHSEDEPAPQPGSVALEDVWWLNLENLRRHLDGKTVVRCDYSRSMLGDIEHQIEIDGSPEAIFQVLISPAQMERWIASAARVEAREGGLYDLGWGADYAMKIVGLEPGRRLLVQASHDSSVVTWTLEGSGGKTRLTLVHSGFAPDQDNSGIFSGWINFMSFIRSIVEYGPGWTPPLLRIAPGMEAIYNRALIDGQRDLVEI